MLISTIPYYIVLFCPFLSPSSIFVPLAPCPFKSANTLTHSIFHHVSSFHWNLFNQIVLPWENLQAILNHASGKPFIHFTFHHFSSVQSNLLQLMVLPWKNTRAMLKYVFAISLRIFTRSHRRKSKHSTIFNAYIYEHILSLSKTGIFIHCRNMVFSIALSSKKLFLQNKLS